MISTCICHIHMDIFSPRKKACLGRAVRAGINHFERGFAPWCHSPGSFVLIIIFPGLFCLNQYAAEMQPCLSMAAVLQCTYRFLAQVDVLFLWPVSAHGEGSSTVFFFLFFFIFFSCVRSLQSTPHDNSICREGIAHAPLGAHFVTPKMRWHACRSST